MAALGPLPRLGLGPPSKEPQLALRLCAMPSPTPTPREEGSNSMASFGCCRYSRREPSSMASVLVARLPGSPSRTHAGSGTNRRLSLVEALRLLTCGVENRNPRSAQWCQTHSSVTASGHPVTIVRKRTRLLTRRPMGHLSSAQSVTSRGTGSPEGIWAQLPWRRVSRGEARAHFTLRTCPANIFPKPACFPGGILWQTRDMEEGQSTLQPGALTKH